MTEPGDLSDQQHVTGADASRRTTLTLASLAVAFAAQRSDRVRGVINFAGGWTSDRCDQGGRGFNEATFASAGGRTRLPMLWLYAERDRYYSPEWIRRYHGAFARAGGVATFHLFPAFDDDGHRLVDHVELWKKAVDEFYPKSAMQIGEIRDLERSLKDALDYKFIPSAKTPADVAGLFDIVYKPSK